MTHPRIRPCNADQPGKPTTCGAFMVTRTTSDRPFFLRPIETVNNVIGYCVFSAAEKYGVEIHSISVLSNRSHMELIIDPDNLSDFNAWVHRHIAQCLIEHYGRLFPKRSLETVGSKSPPHELVLANENAILEKTVHQMANPVTALLVADYKKWPGLRSTPRDWVCEAEHCKVYKRPNLYFSETGRAPERVIAKFTIPPAFSHWAPMDYVESVESLLNTEHLRLQALNSGKKYLGAKAAMRMHPFAAHNSRRPRYNRNPIVACGGDKRLMHEAMMAIYSYRRAYRAAWNEFKELGSAIFPAGCFKMRTRFHMTCTEGCFDWCLLNPG